MLRRKAGFESPIVSTADVSHVAHDRWPASLLWFVFFVFELSPLFSLYVLSSHRLCFNCSLQVHFCFAVVLYCFCVFCLRPLRANDLLSAICSLVSCDPMHLLNRNDMKEAFQTCLMRPAAVDSQQT